VAVFPRRPGDLVLDLALLGPRDRVVVRLTRDEGADEREPTAVMVARDAALTAMVSWRRPSRPRSTGSR
jgi:hypothetical protein